MRKPSFQVVRRLSLRPVASARPAHTLILHLKRPGTLTAALGVLVGFALRFCTQTNTAHTCNSNLKPSNLWVRVGTLRLGIGQLRLHSNETHNESIADLKILVTVRSVLAVCMQTKTQTFSLIRYFQKPPLLLRDRPNCSNRWNYHRRRRRWNCWSSRPPHRICLTFWNSAARTHENPHTFSQTIRRLMQTLLFFISTSTSSGAFAVVFLTFSTRPGTTADVSSLSNAPQFWLVTARITRNKPPMVFFTHSQEARGLSESSITFRTSLFRLAGDNDELQMACSCGTRL
jgi:hypothetical protein